MTAQEPYEIDFFEWTQRNAELLNRACLEEADIPHIANPAGNFPGECVLLN